VLDQITDEMLTIGVVVVGSLTALVLFAYIAIFINPQIAIKPISSPQSHPSRSGGGSGYVPADLDTAAHDHDDAHAQPDAVPHGAAVQHDGPDEHAYPAGRVDPADGPADRIAGAAPTTGRAHLPAANPGATTSARAAGHTRSPLYGRLRMLGGANCNVGGGFRLHL